MREGQNNVGGRQVNEKERRKQEVKERKMDEAEVE